MLLMSWNANCMKWSMMQLYMCLSCLLIVLLFSLVDTFNIDVQHNYLEFAGEKNSQFGYAISLIKNKQAPLVVGAPAYNNGYGAVFKCRVNDKKCNEVVFNHGSGDAQQTESQQFGFSISYAGKRVIACAPGFNKMVYKDRMPIGKCSVFNEDMKLSYNVVPCENFDQSALLSFGYCLAGISSTGLPYKNKEPVFFLGIPGARHLRGHLISIYAEDGSNSWNPVISQEAVGDFERNSFIGYSVSAGNVTGKKTYGDVIGGAPRGVYMTGHALLYTLGRNKRLNLKHNILNPDRQLGSYFGGAVCTADLDGDQKDDVLVGAPYYSKVQDEGRVYIWKNKGAGGIKFKGDISYDGLEAYPYYLEGDRRVASRFGTTITDIGDINGDGYTDIAIGAPGDEQGAVFIYNCHWLGIRKDYSQVIYASTLPGNPLGLGMSIASGVDVDGNSYNDVAIGAYMESKVYIFKSRPVIDLKSSQRTNVTGIPPERKYINCYWKNIGYYCISLHLALRYDGKGTPDSFPMEVTLGLDNETLVRKRAFMVDEATNKLVYNKMKKLTLQKLVTNTMSVPLYIEVSRHDLDITAPIKLSSFFKAFHDPNSCGDLPCGILDRYATNQQSSKVSYKTQCGDDSICETDLRMESSLSFPDNPGLKEIIFGVCTGMLINSTIYNSGEPAYQAKMITHFNTDFDVDRVEINGKSFPLWDVSEQSAGNDVGKRKVLLFNLPSPIPAKGSVNALIKLSIISSTPSVRKYNFTMEARSIGREMKDSDNKKVITIGTKVETCLGVNGDASPSHIMSRLAVKPLPKVNATTDDIGEGVEYTFYVKNNGHVPVESLLANIGMVAEKDGVKLICVQSITVDNVPCQRSSAISDCQTIINQPKLYGSAIQEKAVEKNLSCDTARCGRFSCHIKRISQGKGASIKIMARVLNINLAKIQRTTFETSIDVMFIGKKKDLFIQREGCTMEEQVSVTVEVPLEQAVQKIVPLWMIMLAAVGALLLLAILIFALYKAGFFKRKKPAEGAEGEQLNKEEEEEE